MDSTKALDESELDIPGLKYVNDIITAIEEEQLLYYIDKQPWNTALSRRTQHYGYTYDYKLKCSVPTTPIPAWCYFLMTRLVERGILSELPNQLIVNEYKPGQGIYPHVDDIRAFGDGIVSVSLGSTIIMDLTCIKTKNTTSVFLRQCSAIAFHGEARYAWRHGIAPRKQDNGIIRKRRVSLTFRKMLVPVQSKKAKLSS
jgi:alkylated DNA repair dioxygenase AlkB